MKRHTIGEIILLIFSISVAATILISVVGIAVKGNSNPSPEAVEVRKAIIELLKYITASVLGIVATLYAINKKTE